MWEALRLDQDVTRLRESLIREFFGITLAGIGLAALVLGLTQVYSPDGDRSWIAMFLIFGGEIATLSGAWLARTYQCIDISSKVLYTVCFVVSVILMVMGLFNVFTEPAISLYLLIVAFLAAFVSAWILR